jgi:hypothetical protein
MLNFTMKKFFSEKRPLSLNRWPQDNINYIFEFLVENTLKCNQIKNVHIGENGQGPLSPIHGNGSELAKPDINEITIAKKVFVYMQKLIVELNF